MENESSGTFKLDCSAYRPANPISISQAPRLPSKHSRLSKLRKLAASASHRAIRTIDSISQVGNLEIMPRQQNRPSTRPPKSLLKRHKVRSLSSRELRLVKQRSTAITRPSLSTRDLHTRTHHSTKEVPENHPVKKRNQSVDTAGSQCVYLDTLLPPFRQCFFF